MSNSKKKRRVEGHRAANRLSQWKRKARRERHRRLHRHMPGMELAFGWTGVFNAFLIVACLLWGRIATVVIPGGDDHAFDMTKAVSNVAIIKKSRELPQDPQQVWLERRRVGSAAGRKSGTRSKVEIEREQQEVLAQVHREVDALVAEYHQRLPRAKAKRIGSLYARYSSKKQASIPDQVRTLLEIALREGTFIPRELIFFDLAVRGYRDRRPGLNALRETLPSKKFTVLFVFGTSRLFRKAHRAIRFVEEEIVEQKMHCVFIQQNIDTRVNKDWRLHLMIQAAIDENGTSMYAENIRAAQQGMFLRLEVHGSLPLGYHGVPIEGGGLTRRGRPKCRITIDPETKVYVERIFHWYLIDGMAMDAIARRLNDDPEAPSPPKSTHGMWTHASVRGVLAKARYRGFWEYGVTQAVYQSVPDYIRQVRRDAPLQAAFIEDLRIVSDDIWYRTQQMLLEERGDRGRKATKSDPKFRPKLLNGMLYCPVHERPLQTGGSGNRAMVCKLCRATECETRPLYTQLDRALALRLTLEKLTELLRGDDGFLSMIVEAFRREAEAGQRPDPEGIAQLKAQVAKKTRVIEANQRNPGETEADQKETDDLLRELRADRTKLKAQLAVLEGAQQRAIRIPSVSDVRESLEQLGTILTEAASGEEPEDPRAVRKIIQSLTGGQIALYQQGERKPKRGWLQGRFTVRLLPYLWEDLTGTPPLGMEDGGVEVIMDYREPPKPTAKADQAWKLYLDDAFNVEIAEALKWSKSNVSKVLREMAQAHGVPYEDGRSRRSRLGRRQRTPLPCEAILAKARPLLDAEMLLTEIVDKLEIDRSMMTKVYNLYRAEKGLPPLDGRSRRKLLPRKSRPPQNPEP